MKSRPVNRGRFYALTLGFVLLLVGVIAACGSSSGSNFKDNGNGSDSGLDGKVGSSGSLGSSGTSGSGGEGGTTGGLTVDPPTASIVVTDITKPPTQSFTAKDLQGNTVNATWTLGDYTAGSIDTHGVFSAKGTVSATVTVTATSGGSTGTATVNVTVQLSQALGNVTLPDGTVVNQDSSAISDANRTALGGTPTDEGAGGTTLVYPYDQTVMPRGILAPVPQYSSGTHPPEDFKVALDATGFHWEGLGHVPTSGLQAALPQNVWDGAFLSAQPDSSGQRIVTITLIKAAGGVAYGPATTHIVVAPASLTGVIYYSSYSQEQIQVDGGASESDFGLWSVRPGTTSAPNHLNTGCVICHSVAANGKVLTTGADPSNTAPSGVYSTNGTTISQLATAPTTLGGDTRGLSWAAITPDGNYVVRSATNFWGGDILQGWKTPATPDAGQPLGDPITITGSNIKTYVPSFSPDGTKLVYVNADSANGTPSQSVGVMNVAVQANGIDLSTPTTIYDSTKAGGNPMNQYTRVPMFLPDSKNIVFQQTDDTAYGGFNGMLPNYTDTGAYTPGALYTLHQNVDGSYTSIALAAANTGSKPEFSTANYEPKPLPVQAGGYYWVVFTSIRSDGLNGPAIKKLWITAISPGAPAGSDPSHPPFLVTNQSIIPTQHCERGYWSVEPCHDDGQSCATGDDCCNGFCRPSVDGDPSSPFVCKKPTTVTCANDGDRCRAGHSEDCCGAASGEQCIGSLNGFGTCGLPSVK